MTPRDEKELEKYYRLVDWLLYNLPALKEKHEEMMPNTSASVVIIASRKGRAGSKIEQVSIRRADLGVILDRVQRALKKLTRRQKKVYRLRYRVGMSYSRIAKKIYFSEKTVEREIKDIRNLVALELQGLPPGAIRRMLSGI
jgi:RNA polymerase sigma factor (sigma-70 family)